MMDGEHYNSADEEKEPGKHIKAAFYEKLLMCCACGKIYFSRGPIALHALSRKSFHICADCSAALTCSRCMSPLSPDAALVVEDPHHSIEILCGACGEGVIAGSGMLLKRIRIRLRVAVSSMLNRLFHGGIWPRRRRARY